MAKDCCKPGSLALTRMAVGRNAWSEEVTEDFIGQRVDLMAGG